MSLQHWRAVALMSLAALVVSLLWPREDRNAHPRYGNLGLPANCHAYVDQAIASYRRQQFTIDETLAGLERNCGAGGSLWRE